MCVVVSSKHRGLQADLKGVWGGAAPPGNNSLNFSSGVRTGLSVGAFINACLCLARFLVFSPEHVPTSCSALAAFGL
jgi:hypothetical protein